MKLATAALLMWLVLAGVSEAQTNGVSGQAPTAAAALVSERAAEGYTVKDATPSQEAALRAEIRQINPPVLPLRVFFLPHWKYLDTARAFQLHVPKGYGSLMFTHLPSRTIFVDNDRYQGEEWLGYWIAHELGHLAMNSAKEEDAEKAAKEYRKRLKQAPVSDAW